MFGSQDELTKPLPNKMTINIVGNNYLNEALISTCLDITEGEYCDKFRVINFSNIDEMILNTKTQREKNEESSQQIYGLLNLNWIKKASLLRPGTIILVYDIKSKSESISWREFENSIFIDISKCKKIEKSEFLNIVVIIIANSSSFNFDNVNDEKDKIYSIKKNLDAKNLIYVNGLDNLKANSKKLSVHLVNITVNYYRQLKKKQKQRLVEAKDYREFVIKRNIKLGILSQMKNKKRNFKYFESAYANLIDLIENLKIYAYGNDLKMNYFELKAVADWLYFKSLQIKLSENKPLLSLLNSFSIHMQFFSKVNLLLGPNGEGKSEKDKDLVVNAQGKRIDFFLIVEYYWKILRYEGFARLLEENIASLKDDMFTKNNVNFPGYYSMLASFDVKRLLQVLDETSSSINQYQQNYNQNTKLVFRESKFYGRQYKIYEQVDPLTEKALEFDKVIYIKNFISTNNLNKATLSNRLLDNLVRAEKSYKKYLLTNPNPENANNYTMNIYFNFLSMLNLDDFGLLDDRDSKEVDCLGNLDAFAPSPEQKSNLLRLNSIFKGFVFNSTLFKFKDLYVKFLNNYNEVLKLDGIFNNHKDNSEEILLNLFNLSAVRVLTEKEQDLFNNIIYNEKYFNPGKPIKHKYSLKKRNSILRFNFSISNHNPKIFDIFEYNYHLTSELDKEIKLKSISIIYNNQDRNKNYFDSNYEVSKSKPLNLKNVFQVKESDNNLTLKAIRCELQTENQNVIYLEMQVKNDTHKTLVVKQMENPVIEFKYKKHLQIGVEQYFKFEMEIIRKDKNISIENLNLNFRISDKEIKDHFSKTNILGPSSSKNMHHQRSSSLSQNPKEDHLTKKSSKEEGASISLFDPANIAENFLSPINHEIITLSEKSENKDFSVLKNNCVFNFKVIEENEKCEFLVKFNDKGNYYIILDAEYKIIKKEILDDFSLMKYTGETHVDVVNAFINKFEIFSPSYMSLQKIKIFPANKQIKLNLNIANEIKEDFKITKINLLSKSEEIKLDSFLIKLLKDSNKEAEADNSNCKNAKLKFSEIFNIKKSTEYTIPIGFRCSAPYSGSPGQVEIYYTTAGLEEFSYKRLENKITCNIPEYNIKNFDVDLSFEIPKEIKSKENFNFDIHINNRSEEGKRLLLLIESTQYFIINGRVKERIVLGGNESIVKSFNLTPLNFGKLKLPAFKIMEYPFEANNFENKIYSIYYLPDNIHIN